ncbi:MAG: 4-hydroxythreonine-4-phosphate dehydrogenase PdxA [Bdellovibrionaceae bacterium]|nr:4-hydroxythreonine-4-phosphate dehydrogenase PdxA [Pseudobdellovibrionaceae bacterium]
MSGNLKISITTGDTDGIGLEVAQKALLSLGPMRGTHFLLWRSPKSYPKNLMRIASHFKINSFSSPDDALKYLLSEKMTYTQLVEVVSNESPALWVERSAKWCCQKKIHGIVTGPISKTEIYRAGLKDMGHTDILKRISGVRSVFMGFLGQSFNVVLATSHVPLSTVTSGLTPKTLLGALEAADLLRRTLAPKLRQKPIALVGINPHAGEAGLIGREELQLFPQLIQQAQKKNIRVSPPLSPDSAFQKEQWNQFSVYLTMYHDQGLIPFKMIHKRIGGVHISIGLPFVRTSVDHGTAKDIFGKNKAHAESMVEAIQTCIKLVKASIK